MRILGKFHRVHVSQFRALIEVKVQLTNIFIGQANSIARDVSPQNAVSHLGLFGLLWAFIKTLNKTIRFIKTYYGSSHLSNS